MEKETENKIINLYLSGLGSTTIIKLIPNITKRNILKLLKEKNIIRNRLLGDEFYKDYLKHQKPEKIIEHLNSHPIKGTKLYWLLSRCLVKESKNRSILLI